MSAASARVTRAGVTEFRHQIHGPTGPIAIYTRRSSGTADTYYLHRDHLGSPELVTNAAGTQIVKLSFGAFGERRGTNWTGTPSSGDWTAIGNTTRDGFTDHEHLDSVGLIHMNGRVYDPRIGRFLSPDPFIDCGLGSQGVNRYGYVGNNPLRRIDPSGYTAFEMEEILVTATRIGRGFTLGGGSASSFGFFVGTGGGGAQPGGHEHFSADPANEQEAGADREPAADASAPDPMKDDGGREQDRAQCLVDCKNSWEGGMQTAAGAVGGAVGAAITGGAMGVRTGSFIGVLGGVGLGAIVGGVTGASSGFTVQAVRSNGGNGGAAAAVGATMAAPVGYTATAFSLAGRATFGAAMFGAASGAAGGLLPGIAGAAAGSGLAALAATQASRVTLAWSAGMAMASAVATYQLASVVRDIRCESKCSAY